MLYFVVLDFVIQRHYELGGQFAKAIFVLHKYEYSWIRKRAAVGIERIWCVCLSYIINVNVTN